MTETGDPLENAIAERINGHRGNGIIKQEYLECYEVEDITQAKELLTEVVSLYNVQRPHMSIGNMKPADLHQNNQQTKKL